MPADVEDLYKTLDVNPDADSDSIRKAYLRGALQWHPDKNPADKERAEDMFKKLARAYKVLSDPELRAQYDAAGIAGLKEGWWPDDPLASMSEAWIYFKVMKIAGSPLDAFSDAKLAEMFPLPKLTSKL
mmetsp:Transcript_127314/g.271443  ORF Transcript_127314/g.271443 Transcript_127314/m.271443 type:complete len:129 (-) Transcript_127314:244-630(-)